MTFKHLIGDFSCIAILGSDGKECFSVTKSCHETRENVLRPEINLQDSDPKQDQLVNVGYVPVRIQKMFGPLIFCDIRIRAVPETCEWVIEVEHCNKEGETEWKEHCRIAGQDSIEFDEE